MTRRQTWLALTTALGVLVAAAVVGWNLWSPGGGRGLVRYDDGRGIANRYADLGDGDAQLSIGSPDRHRIVVQWRDADGDRWTAPRTVYSDDDTAIDNTVRTAGGTVAITQMYTPDVHDDSDVGTSVVGIVCRDQACTARPVPGFGAPAQLTPDGRTVYLGQNRKGATLWTADAGIHLAPWSGHPGFTYGVDSPSEPVLAADGSLRVVTSHPSRRTCTFELLVGTPQSADLTSASHLTEPLRGQARSDCQSSLETESSDSVEVHPTDHRADDFWFVRHGDGWATTSHDPAATP